MKVKITESDIKRMVSESVKKTILETIDKMELSELIHSMEDTNNLTSQELIQLFGDIYGQDAARTAFSTRDMYGAMAQIINSGTPEQEQNFRESIGGWEVPDDMMYAINECVNRVVTKKLHE